MTAGPAREGDELGCPRLTELVTEYLEEALPAPERAEFEEHLRECPGCVVYLDQARHTIRTIGRLPRTPPPPEVRANLIAAFKAMRGTGADCDQGTSE